MSDKERDDLRAKYLLPEELLLLKEIDLYRREWKG